METGGQSCSPAVTFAYSLVTFSQEAWMHAIENATESFIRQNRFEKFVALALYASIPTHDQHILTRFGYVQHEFAESRPFLFLCLQPGDVASRLIQAQIL